MFILEWMREGTVSPIWLTIAFQAIGIAVVNTILARAKNYNIWTALAVAFIPIANWISLLVYIGLPRSTKNIDEESTR